MFIGTWTKNLSDTNSPFTIKGDWGISQFTLKCTSAGSIYFKGNKNLDGMASEDIELKENETYSFSSQMPVSDFVITIPAGCLGEIVAQC